MNTCRHCGAKLSRLDKDICPFCGGRNPLEGSNYQTQDLTKSLEPIEIEEVKYKSKYLALALAIILGMFGANEFYLGYKKAGFIVLGLTVILVAVVALLKAFVIDNILIIIIPLAIYEVMHIIQGLSYLAAGKKDKRGELLR